MSEFFLALFMLIIKLKILMSTVLYTLIKLNKKNPSVSVLPEKECLLNRFFLLYVTKILKYLCSIPVIQRLKQR